MGETKSLEIRIVAIGLMALAVVAPLGDARVHAVLAMLDYIVVANVERQAQQADGDHAPGDDADRAGHGRVSPWRARPLGG